MGSNSNSQTAASNQPSNKESAGPGPSGDDLAGKVVQITGGTGGIGWACARLVAERGARVALCGHNRNAEDAVSRLPSVEGGHLALQLDVTDEQSVKAAAMRIRKELGGLDGLVHCAGVIDHAVLGLTTAELMNRMFQVNTVGTTIVLRYAARLMARKKRGSIVCLSSAAAQIGNAGQSAYAASKAAVDAIVRTAARELATQGIRVNGVAPGYIETDMTADLDAGTRQTQQSRILLRRFGEPAEVAEVVTFLVSDAARYITAQVWRVDGGMLP